MATRPDDYPYQRRLTDFDTIVQAAQRTIIAQVEMAVRSGDLSTAMGRNELAGVA